jgi:hypothetical protein
MSTTHLVAPEEVMALLDGELTAERAPFVSAHIEECAQCSQVAESLSSTSETLTRWTVASAPANPEFQARLFDAAKNRSQERHFGNPIWTASFLRQPWVVAAGTLVLAACILLTFSMRRHQAMTEASRGRNMSVDLASAPKAISPIMISPMAKPPRQVAGDSTATLRRQGGGSAAPFSTDGQPVSKAQEGEVGAALPLLEEKGFASPVDRFTRSDSQEPMIAQTASLSLIVKDFGAARVSVDAILTRYRGYSAELSVATPQGTARTLQASLRVPAPQLFAAIAELKALGRVESEDQSGEEVTQQHAGLMARLKNSRETEQRLQAILLQRTGKISDVLAVEQEIARVRGEIEQMEAEQKSLEHRVEFATVNLTLAEEYKAQINSPSPSISTRLHNGLVGGYRDVLETVVSIILFFAEYGPTLLLWFALLFPVGWFVRRRWLRAQGFGSSLPA